MELRDRRLAQIVRDFMEAYALSTQITAELRAGNLRFATVSRLVGDAEDSALYRLKEECHALFRFDSSGSSRSELQAEELFDLAVGALFHEAMKFREGYYVIDSYGPRLRRMIADGAAIGPLAGAFLRVLEAGRQRTEQSAAELTELFRETRDQLRSVLRQLTASGSVARSFVQDAELATRVFGVELPRLLAEVYGSASRGFQLAIESLIENGHYAEAAAVLERSDCSMAGTPTHSRWYARGMASYYGGNSLDSVESLERWANETDDAPPTWRQSAVRALGALEKSVESSDGRLAVRARTLARSLRGGRVA